MDIYLLQNMAAILITAVIVLLIFNKLKLPTMIGLFITGIVLGHAINDTSINKILKYIIFFHILSTIPFTPRGFMLLILCYSYLL